MANVGQELLAVPLPEMVMKLGLGIAEAQRALDENSVETAHLLADTHRHGCTAISTMATSTTTTPHLITRRSTL